MRILVALLFLTLAGVISYEVFLSEEKSESSSQKMTPFQSQIWKDLNLARSEKMVSKTWDQISEIRYRFHSEKVKLALNNAPLVATNKKGTKRLLVEFYQEPDSDDYILIRYSIIDLKTGNFEEEVNRRLKVVW